MKKYDVGYLEAVNDFRDEAAAKLEEQDYITFDDLNEIAERMKESLSDKPVFEPMYIIGGCKK